jgi:lipopolysaccharide transport system ATP-binding protein
MERQLATPPPQQVAIGVREVGKMYRIYEKPQDRLKQMLLWRIGRSYGHEFWALRGVSFQIYRGESVGIIGRNGSGKSTLLQIIAGTLSPSEGEVQTRGRVAALLELGSGFNVEFTGRENVFLNGSILGIERAEMEARYDEIVEFADIGEFIDQPVKTYSSGMVVRLAFAVQAVVEKEILIVDEALAVGDEAFQRKCMRKLEEFREQGGTVLLVTHGVETIVRQCSRALWLHQGELQLDGPSKIVTDIYQRFIYGTAQQQVQTLATLREHGAAASDLLVDALGATPSAARSAEAPDGGLFDSGLPQTSELAYGTREAEIIDPCLYDSNGEPINVVVVGQRVIWRFHARFHTTARNLNFGMSIRAVDGVQVAGINTFWEGQYFARFDAGDVATVNFQLNMNIAPGTYYIESGIIGDTERGGGEMNFLHRRVDICAFRVITPDSRTISGIAHLQPQIHVSSR